MGVKHFFEAFEKAAQPVKDLTPIVKDKTVAIDMMLVLCRAIKAIHHSVQLTDAHGTPTSGLNLLIALIDKLRREEVRRIIAIFDNPAPNPFKAAERAARHERAEEYKERAKAAETKDECSRLEHHSWQITDGVIADAMRFLTMAGIEYHVAPVGREAEQYAADLAKLGIVDVVMSDDSDSVMFGAPIVIMARPTYIGRTLYPYTLWDIRNLLERYTLTLDQFQRICIALGTDFAEKMPHVGVVTAHTRGKNKELSAAQMQALEYVASPPIGPNFAEIIAPRLDLNALVDWLVNDKSFNRARIGKKILSWASLGSEAWISFGK